MPSSINDGQFEVVMLDPYIRTSVIPPKLSTDATHRVDFTLPDKYGVFKFLFDYKRRGVTFLEHSETVQVRPYRHDQYPRFLTVAYPYYTVSWSMMLSFVVLSMIILYHRDTVKLKKK